MFRFSKLLLVSLVSCVICFSTTARSDDSTVSTTTVNPVTQESTTTTVNPGTQETTSTTVNPNTQQTTITKTNPVTNQTTTTIITPAPAPQEVVAPPQGSIKCYDVDAGWYRDIWVPSHQVCQYDASVSTNQGVAWIGGHWICTKYTVADQACTKWDWRAGHWAKTMETE